MLVRNRGVQYGHVKEHILEETLTIHKLQVHYSNKFITEGSTLGSKFGFGAEQKNWQSELCAAVGKTFNEVQNVACLPNELI